MTGVLFRARCSGGATQHSPAGGAPSLKTAEERMNIVDRYRELGSYRAAARACGVDHK